MRPHFQIKWVVFEKTLSLLFWLFSLASRLKCVAMRESWCFSWSMSELIWLSPNDVTHMINIGKKPGARMCHWNVTLSWVCSCLPSWPVWSVLWRWITNCSQPAARTLTVYCHWLSSTWQALLWLCLKMKGWTFLFSGLLKTAPGIQTETPSARCSVTEREREKLGCRIPKDDKRVIGTLNLPARKKWAAERLQTRAVLCVSLTVLYRHTYSTCSLSLSLSLVHCTCIHNCSVIIR